MKNYNVTRSTNWDSSNNISQGITKENDINNSEINNQRQKRVKFETNGNTMNSNNVGEGLSSRTEYDPSTHSTHETQRKNQSNSVSTNNKNKSVKNFEQCGEIDLINSKTKTESLSVRRIHKVNKVSRTTKYIQSTNNEISFSSRSTMHNLNTEKSNFTRKSGADNTGGLSAVYSAELQGNSHNIKENITACSKALPEQHTHFVLKNSESYIDHTHLDYGRVDLVDSNLNWKSNCVKKFFGVKRETSQQNRLVNCDKHKSDSIGKENLSALRSCARLEISNRNDFFINNISQVVENKPKQEYKLETYSIDLLNEEKASRISSFAILNKRDEFELETYSINLLGNERIERDNLEVKEEVEDAPNKNKENSFIENKTVINSEVKLNDSTEGLLIPDEANFREDCSENQEGNGKDVEIEKDQFELNDDKVKDKNSENISIEDMSRNNEKTENKSNVIKETSDLYNSYNYVKIKSEQLTISKIENSFEIDRTKEITNDNQSAISIENLNESISKKPNLIISSELLKISIDLSKIKVIDHEINEEEKVLVNISDSKEDKNSDNVEIVEPKDNNLNSNDALSDLNNITTQRFAVNVINENNDENLVTKNKMASNCILRKNNKRNYPNKNNDCVIDNTNTLEIIKDKEIKINPAVINTSYKIASTGEIIYGIHDSPLVEYKQDLNEEEGEIISDFQDNEKEDHKLLIETSSSIQIAHVEYDNKNKPNLRITLDNSTNSTYLSKILKEESESTEAIEFKARNIRNKLNSIDDVKENLLITSLGMINYEHSKEKLGIIKEEQISPVASNLISNKTSPKTSNSMLIIEDVYSYTYINQSQKNITQNMQNAEIGVKSPYEIQVNLNQTKKRKVYEKRRPDTNYNYLEKLSGGVKTVKNYEFIEILSDKDVVSISKPLNSKTEESGIEIHATSCFSAGAGPRIAKQALSYKEENTEAKEKLNNLFEKKSSKVEEQNLELNDDRLISKTSTKNLFLEKNVFDFSLENITADKSSNTDNKNENEMIHFSNLNNLPLNIINNDNDQISSYSLLVDNKFNNRQKKMEEGKSEGKCVNFLKNEHIWKDSIKISEDDRNDFFNKIVLDAEADEITDDKNIRSNQEKFIPENYKNSSNLSQFLTNISHNKQKENLKKFEDKIKNLNEVDDKIYESNFIQPQEFSKLEGIKYDINSNNYYKQSTELSDKTNENKNKTSFIQIYQKSKLNLNNSKGKKYNPEKFENWQLNLNTSRVNENSQNTSTNNKKEKSLVNDKVKYNDVETSYINKSNFISEEEKKKEISNNSSLTNQKLKTTPTIKKFKSVIEKSFNTSEGYKNIRNDLQKDPAATTKNQPKRNSQFISSENWQLDDTDEKLEKGIFCKKIPVVPKLEFNDRSQIEVIMMKYGLSNQERSNKINHTSNQNVSRNNDNNNNNISSSLYKSPQQKTLYNFDNNIFNLKISPKLKHIPRNNLNKSTNSNIGNKQNDSSLITLVNQHDQQSFTQQFHNKHLTKENNNDYTNINSFNYTVAKADKSGQKAQIEKDNSNCNISNASFIQNSNLNYKQSHVDKLGRNILDKSRLNNSNTCDNLNYKSNPMKTIKQTYEEYISHLNQIAHNHNINSLKINLDNYRFEYDTNVKKINTLINDYKITLSECECDINCRICFEFYLKHNHYLYSKQKRGKLFYNLQENRELIKVQSASFFSDKNSRDSVLNSSCMKKSFDNSNNSNNNFNLNTQRINFPVIYPTNKL